MKNERTFLAIAVIFALVGIVIFISQPKAPPAGSETATTTTPAATSTTPAHTTKPATSKPAPAPATTSPAGGTAAPAAPIATLSVKSKSPDLSYTPPTAAITFSITFPGYTPAKNAKPHDGATYVIDYGDGTQGLLQFFGATAGSAGGTETWRAEHAYNIPGTYTARALNGGKEAARTTFVVTGDQIR